MMLNKHRYLTSGIYVCNFLQEPQPLYKHGILHQQHPNKSSG